MKLSGVVALRQDNTGIFQLGAHRWVDVTVAAGHLMPHGFGQLRKRAHKCAANT